MSPTRSDQTGVRFSFEQQLRDELSAVAKAREAVDIGQGKKAGDGNGDVNDDTDSSAFEKAHRKSLCGLAFSGGGIRSATFNLGVIQGLARLGLLHRFDYLSTVSGGGYIGSWLSAWVHRVEMTNPPGILRVQTALKEPGFGNVEAHEVRWLRRFSNYLTPKVGALSSDTLTGVATFLRNLLLNQTILIAFGAALLLFPWWLASLMGAPIGEGQTWSLVSLYVAIVLLLAGTAVGGYETRRAELGRDAEAASEAADERARFRNRMIVLCFATASLVAGISMPFRATEPDGWWPIYAVTYGLGMSAGWSAALARVKVSGKRQSPHSRWWVQIFWALLAALAFGVLLLGASSLYSNLGRSGGGQLLIIALGPVVFLGALLLTITLHLGLVSRGVREAGRELWSYQGGQLVRLAIGWLLLVGSALFGPLLLMKANAWVAGVGGVSWIATTLAGVLAGSGRATGGRDRSKIAEVVARIAPYVFVVGLLLILSYGLFRGIWWGLHNEQGLDVIPKQSICRAPVAEERSPIYGVTAKLDDEDTNAPQVRSASGLIYDASPSRICALDDYMQAVASLINDRAWPLFWMMLAALVGSFLFSRRVDINAFGLNSFYRNRIERCYMGASNRGRRPHPATGLDPTDSPRLADLVSGDGDPRPSQRPLPIVNAALNVTSSKNLAWQERKAASFTFTPMFCGYEIESADAHGGVISGYQRTAEYLKPRVDDQEMGRLRGLSDGFLSLGLPIAISGAAASPNSGYHTSPATAFLMTVFNVRLGWWLQNPKDFMRWREPGPKLALVLLMQELAGMTTDRSRYVYLSDGGHFENLGIYELVRRRCRYIVACDAGCDPEYQFEDLGNAVRKCQIDLGVRIDIRPRAIRPDPDTKRSTFHCAVGRIHYPDGPLGYLLYVKASVTGDEPADVLQYALQNPGFPHQSTLDQWYSESQLESYRNLGEHILGQVLEGSVANDLEETFNRLTDRWYPPSQQIKVSFADHGKSVDEIFERIRKDDNLRFLDKQIYPEWPYLEGTGMPGVPATPAEMLPDDRMQIRAGFYLCNSLIQLMENVYHDLELEEQHDHPDNRGWMNLFRHWSWAPMVRVTWSISASTYGARFQRFCRHRLDLPVGEVVCTREPLYADLPAVGIELNFIEVAIKRAFEALCDSLQVVQVWLEVTDAYGDRNEPRLRFPFAFAVVRVHASEGRLLYYRVRDHLRSIGLGRKGLALLHDGDVYCDGLKIQGVVPLTADREKELKMKVKAMELDQSALMRLWDSVVSRELIDGRNDGGLDWTL